MEQDQKNQEQPEEEEKSFFKIIVHSFFIIPFLIAVFCVLLFGGMHLLTQENRSVYDYLNDIKSGGATKRWQGAFELSKILSNPQLVPDEERFSAEMINAFKQSEHDDPRVRQYLALAMGRTGRDEFLAPLLESFKNEKDENIPALLYALGMLKNKEACSSIYQYLDHPTARIRSIAVVSLGNIANPSSIDRLKKMLNDPEENVQWGAAISLAQMGNSDGKFIIGKLLNRQYLDGFLEIDRYEKTNLILAAIEASGRINDSILNEQLTQLSQNDKNMKIRSAAFEQLSGK